MARTTQEIYTSLEAQLAANSTLAPLVANTSKVAIWRLLLWVFAYGANVLELLFDAFIVEADAKGKAAKVGNAQWYQARILEFQYGDLLAYINGIYQYAIIDTSKNIVARCSVTEGVDPLIGGVLNIKIAKNTTGVLTALDAPELAALTSYLQKVKFAGTKFKLISTSGDILKITFSIYYEPIIPIDVLKPLVIETIENYVKNLPFDGILNITRLIDAIQVLEGIKDCIFINAASKPNIGATYTTFTRENNPFGGYYNISGVTGEQLDDTLNFIAV